MKVEGIEVGIEVEGIICGFPPDNCDTLDELIVVGIVFKKVIEFNYEIKKSYGKICMNCELN